MTTEALGGAGASQTAATVGLTEPTPTPTATKAECAGLEAALPSLTGGLAA